MQRENIKTLEDAVKSVERIQTCDPQSIGRGELGVDFNFNNAISYIQDLVTLYKQLNITILEDIPDNKLSSIKSRADADFNIISEIRSFSPKQQDPNTAHTNIHNKIKGIYQPTFDILHPFISYSVSKSADFKRLETEARAMIQSVKDSADELNEHLKKDKKQADDVLDQIRKVAAEQGVSQQAIHFKDMADQHETLANEWQKKIFWTSIILGAYAILSIFIHKISFLAPTDSYQTVQLAISKVLIFGVISFYLYLSAKNYLSHKHNSIVNRHRQSALMTFNALAKAASNDGSKDIILNHAAACIFGPQPTGYSSDMKSDSPMAKSVVELLTKPFNADK